MRLPRDARTAHVDAQVGVRVRERRQLLGLTQTQLAQSQSLTYQQIQRYEGGVDQISISRLCQIARFLDVPIMYFFDKLRAFESSKQITFGCVSNVIDDSISKRETLALCRAFDDIKDEELRKTVLSTVRLIAANQGQC